MTALRIGTRVKMGHDPSIPLNVWSKQGVIVGTSDFYAMPMYIVDVAIGMETVRLLVSASQFDPVPLPSHQTMIDAFKEMQSSAVIDTMRYVDGAMGAALFKTLAAAIDILSADTTDEAREWAARFYYWFTDYQERQKAYAEWLQDMIAELKAAS